MAQLLHLVKNQRAEPQPRQRLLPAAQKQIVQNVYIRLGQIIGRQAMHHMYPGHAPLHPQKAQRLLQPVPRQMRRWNNQCGQIPAAGQIRQRLYRLAQTHFVRQQTTVMGQQKRKPLLLKGPQSSQKIRRRGRSQGGHPCRLLPAHGVGSRPFQRLVPQRLVAFLHRQRETKHQPI